MTTLAGMRAALERAYPPELAESWDAVGLVCGEEPVQVGRALVCVDPVAETVDEAIEAGADLLLAHHPLLLRGVHGVPAHEPKGALVHRLIREGVALYCAHTNADKAAPGVSDALAAALGLRVLAPLQPSEHGPGGLGRVTECPRPMSLAEFTRLVEASLPASAWGVRAAGEPQREVRTVALAGGAGDGLLHAASQAGADVFLTADLRHHPASEHLQRRDAPALVDVAHWASEWPWCGQAAEVLRAAGSVDVRVSTVRTDPWTIGARCDAKEGGR
jgi:dinuclear metal center YbgI/SA1388 family protein